MLKNDKKLVDAVLPANHPKKELANKKNNFECQILDVKKPIEIKIDDDFAKLMGAKDISDLEKLIRKTNIKSIFASVKLNYKKRDFRSD